MSNIEKGIINETIHHYFIFDYRSVLHLDRSGTGYCFVYVLDRFSNCAVADWIVVNLKLFTCRQLMWVLQKQFILTIINYTSYLGRMKR
jgi:hypothetical protein